MFRTEIPYDTEFVHWSHDAFAAAAAAGPTRVLRRANHSVAVVLVLVVLVRLEQINNGGRRSIDTVAQTRTHAARVDRTDVDAGQVGQEEGSDEDGEEDDEREKGRDEDQRHAAEPHALALSSATMNSQVSVAPID